MTGLVEFLPGKLTMEQYNTRRDRTTSMQLQRLPKFPSKMDRTSRLLPIIFSIAVNTKLLSYRVQIDAEGRQVSGKP